MVPDYVVLASNFGRVRYEICNEPWEPEPGLIGTIEENWQKEYAKAKASGQKCDNNPMARVISYEEKNGILSMVLQQTNWKNFIGTRNIVKEAARCANPLSIGSITITSDGYIVTGRKSPLNDTGVGQIQLAPCGYVDWSDVAGNGNGVASTFLRELGEELNLTAYRPISFTERPNVRQPMIIAEMRVPYDKNEIIEAHSKIPEKDKETDELVFVATNAEAIESFLKEREKELRPHLRCGLKLYRDRLSVPKRVDAGIPTTA
jgi:hypothetical protein